MKFILKPSLEHMALVKIVISLWSQNDVRALIAKHNFSSCDLYTNEKWKTIEEKVVQKVTKLLLPQLLKEKVLGCIKPIGLQILEWMKFHDSHFDLLNLPVELCWTPQGTVDRKKTAEVLCFLISEMKKEQQIKCFRHKPYTMLQYFLQWPWQGFFIEIANCMWDYLSEENYENILRDILHKVRDGYKDYNYQKLFGEFWQKSPNTLKSLITNEVDKSWLLSFLFDIKDKENIRLILKDTSLTVKKKLIYSDRMNTFWQRYILENEWDFLEFCIRECLPSKNEMLKFQEEFEWIMRGPLFKKCRRHKPVMHSCFEVNFSTIKHKWDEMFRSCDDSLFKYDKRSLQQGESSSS